MMLYVHRTEFVIDETKFGEILGDLIDGSTVGPRTGEVLKNDK